MCTRGSNINAAHKDGVGDNCCVGGALYCYCVRRVREGVV